jgi:site-specific recombinase XerD
MQEEELPLPPGVRVKHGSWHYVERHKWRKLCRVDEGRSQLYIRLREVTGRVENAVWYAILSYLSNGMKDLAPATQKHYRNTGWRMLHHFGHYRIDELEPTHAAQYLKWCRDENRAVTGNREKAFMSSVYEYAMSEGWATYNPWRGIRRSKERPSRRYVEHTTLTAALDRAPPALQHLLAVAYLTGIRQTDLRLLRQAQDHGHAIVLKESKTGKENEHEVTPTVRLFLDLAKDRARSFGSDYVFVSAKGLPWSEWGLQSALRRFGAGFRFRDLRRKAQTDRPDKDILGHVGGMRERYHAKRKLKAVK